MTVDPARFAASIIPVVTRLSSDVVVQFLFHMERRFSSLAGCYAFLVALAVLFLVYAYLAAQSPPAEWSGLAPGILHGSASAHALSASQVLAVVKKAALDLRERMHTTWLFFGVFGAVWLTSVLWMLMESRRRGLGFSRQEAYWMGWITLSVFSTAVLYGLGTNGILARRFPKIVTASDVLAAGFLLAVPVIAWSRLQRRQVESALDVDEPAPPSRQRGFLGLNDEQFSARLVEGFSYTKVVHVEPLPSVQSMHAPDEQTKATVNQLIERAELPIVDQTPHPGVPTLPSTAVVLPPVSEHSEVVVPEVSPVSMSVAEEKLPQPSFPNPSPLARESAADQQAPVRGVDHFRNNLVALNSSWQRIEKIGEEIEQWFDQQRRQAIAHLEMHPGLRGPGMLPDLSRNFPSEKLAAVDAEWAEIRRASLEISRWFGDIPAPDHSR
jgi:hypothetical protein